MAICNETKGDKDFMRAITRISDSDWNWYSFNIIRQHKPKRVWKPLFNIQDRASMAVNANNIYLT
jgi:hypothetical protein